MDATPVPSIQIASDTDINHPKPATAPVNPRSQKSSTSGAAQDNDDAAWGSNFWVTLVDPQSQTSFFACPATGQVSWDPPVGSFVLPPSEEGEWWELSDDARGGIPYYYQTKTGATVWERPAGFNTALGRRLSQTTRFSNSFGPRSEQEKAISHNRQSPLHTNDPNILSGLQTNSNRPVVPGNVKSTIKRSHSTEPRIAHTGTSRSAQLTPIPGSDASTPPSPSRRSAQPARTGANRSEHSLAGEQNNELQSSSRAPDSISRARAKSSSHISHRLQQPQSLTAALEKISTSYSDSGHGESSPKSLTSVSSKLTGSSAQYEQDGTQGKPSSPISPSPRRPVPAAPNDKGRKTSGPTVGGKGISNPIPNHAATLQMSPVKNRHNGEPILVHPRIPLLSKHATSFDSGTRPVLPADLVTDIQQFSESSFARQYFSTHRTGFIFRRKVPVVQMMAWQKAPLNSPLLSLSRSLAKDAVKMFRVIQHLMGDREREKGPATRMPPDQASSLVNVGSVPNFSVSGSSIGLLEEERWLLGEGLTHGELRDEIYCQLMKQLTGNPSTESTFKGWQLLCVALITFPPSKNFETYLCSFLQQHTTQHEGRVDVMAKYCLRRLAYISIKGPRGKPPTLAEIETASDSAFNPSTFGESLDGIIRLQERKYPHQKVPIILPFLADGILALGGLKSEGIFRVPGDADAVSKLKLRIDRGYYTTDGVNDPHVLASLMKLWLRELCDPLVPEEMYNECITNSKDPEACVQIIERLPTINRRVVLFVVSFLQHFLEEKAQSLTKMTPANLALVMAPNLLRCNSDSMSVVFTNAQYEQIFVYNLLLHLQCGDVDPDYTPTHGLGATSTTLPRSAKSRSRRS